MPNEYYPHLFLKNIHTRKDYTNPISARNNLKIKDQDKISHGTRLIQYFEKAWKESETRRTVLKVERFGVYVDFISEPGCDLVLKSLESVPSGIRLLNVRTSGTKTNKKTYATVFIPNSEKNVFLGKVKNYLEKFSPKSGNPSNQKLLNNIGAIRRSVLESFWQDGIDLLPANDPIWVEIWLSSDSQLVIDKFKDLVSKQGIKIAVGELIFPERSVVAIKVDRKQLDTLIEISDYIAEIRRAKEIASEIINLKKDIQAQLVKDLLKRTDIDPESDVVVCVLDTGVNNGHSLLQPILSDEDRHTVNDEWGKHDHEGHGTGMAGIAAYGDLIEHLASSSRINLSHRLESAKILPPPPEVNPRELWGYFTSQGVSLAEIQGPNRKRIICLAIATTDELDRGRPSSWSAKLDEITSGADDSNKRFMVVCCGNIEEPEEWRRYLIANKTKPVHDPAQSWNALSVGAFTNKTLITNDSFKGWKAIAPRGGLSPFSTTSFDWRPNWPIKPEVLFEGGNVATGPHDSILALEDLGLISTSHQPTSGQFISFNATSAATAQAAWMAAKIQKAYPDYWPETIRGLIVHSANWTDTMKAQFVNKGDDFSRDLFRCCGYGVPNLDAAMVCASNSLTLISQAELQPFNKKGTIFISQDMHLYKLPWPKKELLALQETPVEMRVTLSYFIEPGPGEIGWKDRYRYPSHGLRFKVNGPTEKVDHFVRRINKIDQAIGGRPGTSGPSEKWVIGESRDCGSIHSDIWRGTASDLANSEYVAILPVVGWWRERANLNKWMKKCRYSLIVSIYTPENSENIYIPVANQIGVPIRITTTRRSKS